MTIYFLLDKLKMCKIVRFIFMAEDQGTVLVLLKKPCTLSNNPT
jgi:hypothetical protein